MANELNEQKAFLTWAKSAAVLQTDARQGIARDNRPKTTTTSRRSPSHDPLNNDIPPRPTGQDECRSTGHAA